MDNTNLISFLCGQVDNIDRKIGKNNVENETLKMNKLHLNLAIERLNDVSKQEGVKDE